MREFYTFLVFDIISRKILQKKKKLNFWFYIWQKQINWKKGKKNIIPNP